MRREEFRHHSFVSAVADMVIAGAGPAGLRVGGAATWRSRLAAVTSRRIVRYAGFLVAAEGRPALVVADRAGGAGHRRNRPARRSTATAPRAGSRSWAPAAGGRLGADHRPALGPRDRRVRQPAAARGGLVLFSSHQVAYGIAGAAVRCWRWACCSARRRCSGPTGQERTDSLGFPGPTSATQPRPAPPIAGHPVRGPLGLRLTADTVVQRDRVDIPVQHRPGQPGATAPTHSSAKVANNFRARPRRRNAGRTNRSSR